MYIHSGTKLGLKRMQIAYFFLELRIRFNFFLNFRPIRKQFLLKTPSVQRQQSKITTAQLLQRKYKYQFKSQLLINK